MVRRREDETGELLQGQPEIEDDIWPFWQAFQALGKSRDVSLAGPVGIRETEFEGYCRNHGILDEEGREELYHFVTLMDAEFLRAHADQRCAQR